MADEQAFRQRINTSTRLLEWAIGRSEFFKAANTASQIEKFNAAGHGNAFNLIRDSIHKDLCITLAMFFDRREDSLSFRLLLEESQQFEPHAAGRLKEAKALFDKWAQEPRQKEIRNLRNRVLAHTDITGEGHQAKYGDEMALLDAAIQIHGAINEAYGAYLDTAALRKAWAADAEKFWNFFGRVTPLDKTSLDKKVAK